MTSFEKTLHSVGFNSWPLVGRLMAIPAVIVILFVYCITTIALRGWALAILWGWFITPTFGIETPRIPFLLGLCLVAAMVTNGIGGKAIKKETKETYWWAGYLMPFFALFAGWIIKQFI